MRVCTRVHACALHGVHALFPACPVRGGTRREG